jgi:hypothetical protein
VEVDDVILRFRLETAKKRFEGEEPSRRYRFVILKTDPAPETPVEAEENDDTVELAEQ